MSHINAGRHGFAETSISGGQGHLGDTNYNVQNVIQSDLARWETLLALSAMVPLPSVLGFDHLWNGGASIRKNDAQVRSNQGHNYPELVHGQYSPKRWSSLPQQQFLDQIKEEKEHLGYPDRRPSFSGYFDKKAREIVKKRWIEHKIWDDEWDDSRCEQSDDRQLWRWKHEKLQYDHAGFRCQSGSEPTRPLNQFIAQLKMEVDRVLESGTAESISHPGISTMACSRVKETWKNRAIWDPHWGELPGLKWMHELYMDSSDGRVRREETFPIRDIRTRPAPTAELKTYPTRTANTRLTTVAPVLSDRGTPTTSFSLAPDSSSGQKSSLILENNRRDRRHSSEDGNLHSFPSTSNSSMNSSTRPETSVEGRKAASLQSLDNAENTTMSSLTNPANSAVHQKLVLQQSAGDPKEAASLTMCTPEQSRESKQAGTVAHDRHYRRGSKKKKIGKDPRQKKRTLRLAELDKHRVRRKFGHYSRGIDMKQ